jgi:hypothetical protein
VKYLNNRRNLPFAAATVCLAALSACGPKTAPAVSTPPSARITFPPQPAPPMGASPNLRVPAMGGDRVRQTVNASITPAQTTWNFRSAYNVAALNCQSPKHAAILVNYRAFLLAQAKTLTAVNKKVDQEFKTRHGASFIRPREAYMTQVYNFYALPPTLPGFCDAALAVSNEAQTVKSADLEAFAARSLPLLDRVFENFYLSYEQYHTDLAGWQARYTPPTAVSFAPAITFPAPSAGQ